MMDDLPESVVSEAAGPPPPPPMTEGGRAPLTTLPPPLYFRRRARPTPFQWFAITRVDVGGSGEGG
jgi:hypothetical protein